MLQLLLSAWSIYLFLNMDNTGVTGISVIEASIGKRVRLNCSIIKSSKPVVWSRLIIGCFRSHNLSIDNDTLNEHREHMFVIQDRPGRPYDLVITQIRLADVGLYICSEEAASTTHGLLDGMDEKVADAAGILVVTNNDSCDACYSSKTPSVMLGLVVSLCLGIIIAQGGVIAYLRRKAQLVKYQSVAAMQDDVDDYEEIPPTILRMRQQHRTSLTDGEHTDSETSTSDKTLSRDNETRGSENIIIGVEGDNATAYINSPAPETQEIQETKLRQDTQNRDDKIIHHNAAYENLPGQIYEKEKRMVKIDAPKLVVVYENLPDKNNRVLYANV